LYRVIAAGVAAGLQLASVKPMRVMVINIESS
jgi:hypothetical protein